MTWTEHGAERDIEASSIGLSQYARYGSRGCDKVVVDISRFDAKNTALEVGLMRKQHGLL